MYINSSVILHGGQPLHKRPIIHPVSADFVKVLQHKQQH